MFQVNGGFTSNFAHETMGKYEPFQPWGQGKQGCEPENMVDVAHKNQGFKPGERQNQSDLARNVDKNGHPWSREQGDANKTR